MRSLGDGLQVRLLFVDIRGAAMRLWNTLICRLLRLHRHIAPVSVRHDLECLPRWAVLLFLHIVFCSKAILLELNQPDRIDRVALAAECGSNLFTRLLLKELLHVWGLISRRRLRLFGQGLWKKAHVKALILLLAGFEGLIPRLLRDLAEMLGGLLPFAHRREVVSIATGQRPHV